MSKYNKECGPNATDSFDDYREVNYYGKGTIYERSHYIEGSGSIKTCNVRGWSRDEDSYRIADGITELCDNCFSRSSIITVNLPSSLTTIGNNCFKISKITSISLPERLKKIGHNNFPPTLTSLEIPKNIKDFFVDNVTGCRDLTRISVDEDNKYFKAKDGILYNYQMTEIIFCPNAKTGKIIIPNTVTRIGDFCFANCKNLDMIVIPTSVVEIGDYAFQGIKIKKLNIRNSVKSIGAYCFKGAVVSEDFKFSNQIVSVPESAFESFECKHKLNFINQLESIGLNAFNSCHLSTLPRTISLYKVKEIKDCAFQSTRGETKIELFSSLDKLGESVFDDTNMDLVLRYFSYVPLKINEDSFGNLGDNATLVVPKGTKIIFENASPWSAFSNIEEWETNEDKTEKGKFIKVSDESYCKRLQSIAESKNKVDRFYVKEIIEDLAQSYLYVDSDEEYEEAMTLIAYNRSFSPAIVPELEKHLCRDWSNKYKLKVIDNSLIDSYASPLVFTDEGFAQSLPTPEVIALPLPEPVEIQTVKEISKSSSVIAYFNEEILKQLQNRLTLARQSVKIAVSWFTNYSLFRQVKQMAENGIKIQLVINNDLINNGGYCLNFNELIGKGVELSLVEYPHLLHHKFVIIDDNLLITGSYNWTRFSGKNYENMVIISDEEVIEQFNVEFDDLVENAEHKCIDKMPDYVKERPEYDRSAFKQYITEELDAQARESTDERDKITALKNAAELNPKYLEKINPGIQEKYSDAFKVVEAKTSIQQFIVNTVSQAQSQQAKGMTKSSSSNKPSAVKTTPKITIGRVLTREQETIIENIKASGLIMVLDVSGSMSDTYLKGHVHEITKKALSASLAVTDEKEVNIWTFGNDASYIGNYGVNQIEQIYSISCQNEGTNLHKFVEKANDSIKDGALCIIFTDDDSSSITTAINGMKQRKKVFWQIIAYESDVTNIKNAIKNVNNTSVVSLSDYKNKTDDEISAALLKNYILWKNKNK